MEPIAPDFRAGTSVYLMTERRADTLAPVPTNETVAAPKEAVNGDATANGEQPEGEDALEEGAEGVIFGQEHEK